MSVEAALNKVEGVTGVQVDLIKKLVQVEGDAEREQLIKAIKAAGFTIEDN